MANNIFEQWKDDARCEALRKELAEIQTSSNRNKREFREVPCGEYEVAIKKLEKRTSQAGNDMVYVGMEVVSGEYKGEWINWNQVIDKAYKIHIMNNFLCSLIQDCADAPDIKFYTYEQYANLLLDVHELISEQFEYGLKYGEKKYGENRVFKTFEITDVYALED